MSLMPVYEIWIPDERGIFLQRAAGSYPGHEEFGDKSRGTVFGKGDGLPGRAWASMQPEIFAELKPPSHFVRGAAAAKSKLVAGLALPVMCRGKVTAVVTFVLGESERPTGIMEIWSPNSDDSILTWRFGGYGSLDSVKNTSIASRFTRGEGSPGRAWDTRLPEISTDLSRSGGFVRHEMARAAGLRTSFSIPVMLGTKIQSIVTLLSTPQMPFGQVMEIWQPTEDGKGLKRSDGFYGNVHDFGDADPTLARGEGLPGLVWQTAMPQLLTSLDVSSGFVRHSSAHAAQLSVAIGIPVIDDDHVTAVVVLLS
jgi:hypothetical protein